MKKNEMSKVWVLLVLVFIAIICMMLFGCGGTSEQVAEELSAVAEDGITAPSNVELSEEAANYDGPTGRFKTTIKIFDPASIPQMGLAKAKEGHDIWRIGNYLRKQIYSLTTSFTDLETGLWYATFNFPVENGEVVISCDLKVGEYSLYLDTYSEFGFNFNANVASIVIVEDEPTSAEVEFKGPNSIRLELAITNPVGTFTEGQYYHKYSVLRGNTDFSICCAPPFYYDEKMLIEVYAYSPFDDHFEFSITDDNGETQIMNASFDIMRILDEDSPIELEVNKTPTGKVTFDISFDFEQYREVIEVKLEEDTPLAQNVVMGDSDCFVVSSDLINRMEEDVNMPTVSVKVMASNENGINGIKKMTLYLDNVELETENYGYKYNPLEPTICEWHFYDLPLNLATYTKGTLSAKLDFGTHADGAVSGTVYKVGCPIIREVVGAETALDLMDNVEYVGEQWGNEITLYESNIVTSLSYNSPSGEAIPMDDAFILGIKVVNANNVGKYSAYISAVEVGLDSTFDLEGRELKVYKNSVLSDNFISTTTVEGDGPYRVYLNEDEILSGGVEYLFFVLDTRGAGSGDTLTGVVQSITWSDGVSVITDRCEMNTTVLKY